MNTSLFLKNARLSGFLVQPGESLEAFSIRYKKHQNLNSELLDYFQKEKIQRIEYENKTLRINTFFYQKIASEELFIWEGGGIWEYEIQDFNFSVIELNKRWDRLQKEIIEHEMIHQLRQGFNQPIFEEYIAYYLSSSKVRAYFGPIFHNSKEPIFLMIITIMGAFSIAYFESFWVLLGLLLVIVFFLLRVIFNQRIFRKAENNIKKIFPKLIPINILISLTDEEIKKFSSFSLDETLNYISLARCPRWQQIKSLV